MSEDCFEKENELALRKRVRRITSESFYGVDLYLFMFTGLQFLLYWEYTLAARLTGGILPEEPTDFFYGVMILIATLSSLVLAWLYFSGKAERGVLFEGPSVYREIFRVREKLPLTRLVSYACMIFLMQILFSYIVSIFELLFNYFGYTLEYSEAMNAEYNTSWTLMCYAILIGPFAEEAVYRGFLMRSLEKNGRLFALIVSGVVFGLMHGDFQQSMFTMAAGLVFGYVAMRYSLWYAFALHVFNNGILGELWVWFTGQVSDTVYIIVALILLVLSAIVTVRTIRRNGADAKKWLLEDKSRPGAWGSLVNLWVILFLAFSITEIIFSISPM